MAFWQLWRTVAEQKTLQQQLLTQKKESQSRNYAWHSQSLLDVTDHVTRWEALPLTGDIVETEDGPTLGADVVIEEDEKKDDSIRKNPMKVCQIQNYVRTKKSITLFRFIDKCQMSIEYSVSIEQNKTEVDNVLAHSIRPLFYCSAACI